MHRGNATTGVRQFSDRRRNPANERLFAVGKLDVMAVAWQTSLFSCRRTTSDWARSTPSSAPGWPTARGSTSSRAGSPGADELFDRLAAEVPWRAEERPMYDRVVAVPRSSPSTTRTTPSPIRSSTRPARRSPPTTRTSWASPSVPPGSATTATAATAWRGTATRSAGATPRTPWSPSCPSAPPVSCSFGPRGGGESVRHALGHGDLLVMGGSCQRTWEHAVPKRSRPVGPRISIQFRPRGVR